MKKWWCLSIAMVAVFFLGFHCSSASAISSPPKNRGLFVTPLRAYENAPAGKVQKSSLTVANITDKPVTVDLSVEQFSVADFTYDYEFTPVKEDWIKFEVSQFNLEPGKSRSVNYSIAVPKDATPGGHYFTLFASTAINNNGSINKVRAATVLYVTVDGKLVKTSEITKETIPRISFGGDIDFTLDVKNTGNTHFFSYTVGELQGWTAKPKSQEVAHILLPGATRTVGSKIAAPLLPGIYTAVYGYKTDDGHEKDRVRHIIFLPLWSLLIPVGMVWLGVFLFKRQKRVRKAKKKQTTDS